MTERAFAFVATATGVLTVLVACGEVSAPEPSVTGAPSAPIEPPAPASRTLTVSNITTGGAFDVDGFTVVLDGRTLSRMDLNESVTIRDMGDGEHTVTLGGVSPNCAAADGTEKSVSVVQGAPAQVRFEVSCTPGAELASIRILFARGDWRSPRTQTSSLVGMNADGSGYLQLTSGLFNDYGPDLSPDGRQILFMRDDPRPGLSPAIYLRTTEGFELPLFPEPAYDPDWSPDGGSVAFIGPGDHWGGPIMVGRSNGGGSTRLTRPNPNVEYGGPAWSPDGTRLAFIGAELGSVGAAVGVWVMNADGSGTTRLAAGALGPVWEPNGRRIAFSDYDGEWGGRVLTMNADGSEVRILLTAPQVSRLVVDDWSADGRFLLYSVAPRLGRRSDVYLLELATGATHRLTADGAFNMDGVFWNAEPNR